MRVTPALAWLYSNFDPVMLRLVPYALVPFVLVFGLMQAPAARPGLAVAAADAPYRFLVVCSECGHRARSLRAPACALAQQDRGYQCPECGRFAAQVYRRGGQVVPPGGW